MLVIAAVLVVPRLGVGRPVPAGAGRTRRAIGDVAAAVLVYRVILFWLPLIAGAAAFVSLRRALNSTDRPELCVVPAAT